MARKLVVEIVGDASSLEKSYARAARSTKTFGREIDRAGRGALSTSGLFRGLGHQVAFASSAFLGGAGFVAAAHASVEAAGNLEEAINKTNVVFGSSAQQVEKWSKTTASSLGLSRRAALETSSTFGALFRPIGIAGQRSARLSEQLVKLGSDLASFYNTDVSDALQAIQSGIVGQARPLRRYGVLLSEARVQQEAMAETGKKHAKSLTDQEKILARINIIMHDTVVAQGDFHRTSEGLANQQRILAANLENLRVGMGNALLPVITHYIRVLNDWLSKSENQKRVADDVKQALDALKTAADAVGAAFKIADDVTGSFKNTLQLLLALGAARKLRQIAIELGVLRAGGGGPGGFFPVPGGGGPERFGKNDPSGSGPRGGGAGLLGRIPQLGAFLFGGVPNQASLGAIGIKDGAQKIGSKWYLVQDGKVVAGPSDRDPRLPKLGAAGVVASTSGADTPGPHNVPAAIAAALRVATRQAAAGPTGPTAAQRNAWFDALISRDLFRAGLQPLRQQLASMGQVAALLTKRIAITKDITRKLNLEDQLLQVNADRAAIRAQLRQQLADQLKAQAEQARAAREAAQFRLLGLGPGGEALTPGVRGLKRQLASVADAVKGTFLDTAHVRSLLAHIRRVLSGGLGAVGKDVRARISQILNDLQSQLKQRTGDQTRFRHVSTEAILAAAGLNLTPAQARRLASALSVVGPGGSIPAHSSAQFAGAGAINVYGDVHMHGVQDPKGLEHHLTKRARQRAHVRRGAR